MVLVSMTDEQFRAKADELRQTQGITIHGPVGTISQGGVTAAYAHEDGTLTVRILDLPTFVSRAYCEFRITAWLGPDARRAPTADEEEL